MTQFFVVAGVSARVFHAALGDGALAVEALGLDLEQDSHTVPGPLGNLNERDARCDALTAS
jgi:hypothetical protein